MKGLLEQSAAVGCNCFGVTVVVTEFWIASKEWEILLLLRCLAALNAAGNRGGNVERMGVTLQTLGKS